MIVYDGIKTEFLRSVENDTIAVEIAAYTEHWLNIRRERALA